MGRWLPQSITSPMRVATIGLVSIASAFLLISITCYAAWVGIGAILCDDRYGPSLQSPTGEYEVQVRESNCGATEPFRLRIVMKNHRLPWIVPYWWREETILEAKAGLGAVTVRWTDEQTLTIEYFSGIEDDIIFRYHRFGLTHIVYEVRED